MNRRTFVTCSTAGLASALAQIRPREATVKAGFSEADITPEIGMEMPGGYSKVFHKSVHDACKIRAAVFDDGRRPIALVGVDALAIPRLVVAPARSKIAARCGIEADCVMVGASHSHSSGPTGMVLPGQFDDASELVRKLAYEQSSCADPRYLALVQDRIVSAVCDAFTRRQELALGVGFGREDAVAFNRRFRMKNGHTFTHPGQGNPDILAPAGPIDPQVGVLGAWDARGNLAGCVVTYACHATTNPASGGISANWIYYLERSLRALYGDDVPVVFLQGFSGDITQVNNLNPYHQPAADDWMRLVGGGVAAAASRVLLSMGRGALSPTDAASTIVKIRRRVPDRARVERCYALAAQDRPKSGDLTGWTFAKEIVLLDALLKREPVADVEVQALQVGPAVFISTPGELFVEFGLALKKSSPFPFTFPVELANDFVGYIPTEEALDPRTGGGYETRLTSYSNLEPTAGRQMVEAGLTLIRKLHPGSVTPLPTPPPFREPWSYGNVPPELH
jgi:neutral ceramidase